MRRDISSQEEVDELKEGLLQSSEQRVYLEQHALPSEYEVVQLHFSSGTALRCSLCGVGIGCHPDGDGFYEKIGYLTSIKIRFNAEKDISRLRKVLLCWSCLDRLERPIAGKTTKLTLVTTPALLRRQLREEKTVCLLAF